MRGIILHAGLAALALLALLALCGVGQPAEKSPPKVAPQAVNRAIDRGVAFLKQQQNAKDGTWVYRGEGQTKGTLSLGMTALAGLTLLHCGVAAKDPLVQIAARFLRAKWTAALRDPNWGRNVDTTFERRTYSVALTILFLDGVGEAGDAALIRRLATWLLLTQNPSTGSWGYGSTLNPNQRDSSNTQFALLGLWAGRRHGVRIAVALARTAKRCNSTQDADGGWSYSPEARDQTSTLAMTCVGLMALALRHAAVNEDIVRPRAADSAAAKRAVSNVANDKHLVRGFAYLGQTLKTAFAAGKSWNGDTAAHRNAYYALWSLERVAVVYNLRTIGGLDWYDGGARYLLAKQRGDGSWRGSWGLADTCFALLFLRRANLVPDATALLEGKISRSDKPGLDPSSHSSSSSPSALEKILTPAPAPTLQPSDREGTKPPTNPAIDAMVHKLLTASATEQDILLKRWRDGKDETIVPALAKAIAKLNGAALRKARAALADHCTRLTARQRREYLHSGDAEIRRAAVLSCALRDDRQHLDRLIELLQDQEAQVADTAHQVLCSLTGKDFGPLIPSTAPQRAAAAKTWQQWWKTQEKK